MRDTAIHLTRQVTVVNELGLHARSAAKIATLARQAAGTVWIGRGDETADATSIIDILTLACEKGTDLTIRIEAAADAAILDGLVKLVESGFGE
jgi:phosphocarrier protein HPr